MRGLTLFLMSVWVGLALTGCMNSSTEETPVVTDQPTLIQRMFHPDRVVDTTAREANRYYFCPPVFISPGGETLQNGERDSLKWQASLHSVARECIINGEQARLRVGVEGRLVLGRAGHAPIQAQLPVEISVKRNNGDILFAKTTRVAAQLTSEQVSNGFVLLDEDVLFQISPTEDMSDITVLVRLKN